MAYEISAYSKGAIFLAQLGYIIGESKLNKTLKSYFEEFKFKHPTPNDFRRVAERISGIQLKWYLTDWTQTTNTIDYAIKSIDENSENTNIRLKRVGNMPMPLDVLVKFEDGSTSVYYIPIPLMRGEKESPYKLDWVVLEDWAWAYSEYLIEINKAKGKVSEVLIDPSFFMADINRENNYLKN